MKIDESLKQKAKDFLDIGGFTGGNTDSFLFAIAKAIIDSPLPCAAVGTASIKGRIGGPMGDVKITCNHPAEKVVGGVSLCARHHDQITKFFDELDLQDKELGGRWCNHVLADNLCGHAATHRCWAPGRYKDGAVVSAEYYLCSLHAPLHDGAEPLKEEE